MKEWVRDKHSMRQSKDVLRPFFELYSMHERGNDLVQVQAG